jgi:hypothetical protein
MDFKEDLKEKRPHLSESSLKTYNCLLRTIYKNCFKDDKEGNISNFETKQDVVMKFLQSKPFNVRKTLLSALVCIAPDVKQYKSEMLEDIKEYSNEIAKQEQSPTQKENNIDGEQIKAIYHNLKQQADFIYKKKFMNDADIQKIQDYILICLLGGLYVVPRRSLDYTEFKIRNVDKEKDNYLDKNKFYFNKYKTAKYYGTQSLEIPVQLKNILTKYIAIIPDSIDYLLFGLNGGKLTAVSLNQKLNRIFDGKVAINALRHAYLTDKYADVMKKTKEMNEELSEMGSSSSQAKTYVKLDTKE